MRDGNISPAEAERIVRGLDADHPLVTLANEFCMEQTGRFPWWSCPKCGAPTSRIGRAFGGLLHRHRAATATPSTQAQEGADR